MESTINQRIADLIQALGANPSRFATSIGVANTVIYNIIKEGGRKNKPSFDLLEKIMRSYDTVNAAWLLTGEGAMFKDEAKVQRLPSKPADNGQYGELVTTMMKEQLKRAYDEIEFLREIIRKADLGKLEGDLITALAEPMEYGADFDLKMAS